MSLLNDCLNAVANNIVNNGIDVVIRKTPKVEEGIDTLPLLIVSPSPDVFAYRHIAFGNQIQIDYEIAISLIAAGNKDYTSNIDSYSSVITTMERRLRDFRNLGIAQIWNTKVELGLIFDRSTLQDGYDYLGMMVICQSSE